MKDIAKKNAYDYAAILGKGVFGMIPVAGSLIAEVIGEIIPHQKLDRLIAFTKILDQKLSSFINESNKEFVKREMMKEECADFFEDALRGASRALSDERKNYIATLTTNALSAADINYNESKHLLRILEEINDIEIVWLRFYLAPTIEGDEEFRKKHENILKPINAVLNSSSEIKDKEALQISYKQHLVEMGLLRNKYDHNGLRMDATVEDMLKVKGYEITHLGELLLRQIGLNNNK